MNHFWHGFEKRSQEKKDQSGISPGTAAAAAGIGTTATGAAIKSIGDWRRDIAEEKAPRSRSLKDLQSKLQPGDIVAVRAPKKDLTPLEFPGGKTLPFLTNAEVVELAHGDPYYHAAVYTGRGGISEAQGFHDPVLGKRFSNIRRRSIKVYRPTGATAAETQKAVEFARNARGTRYHSPSELISFGVQSALGVGRKSCRKAGKNRPLTCTSLAANAYPEQFPRETMGLRDMRKVKGMELVGQYGPKNPMMTRKEKVIQRVVHPVLRNLKWGVGAAGLTYAGVKAKQLWDRRAKEKSAPAPVMPAPNVVRPPASVRP